MTNQDDLSPGLGGQPEDNSPGLPREWAKHHAAMTDPAALNGDTTHIQARLVEVLFTVVVSFNSLARDGSTGPEGVRRALSAAGWMVTRITSGEPGNGFDYPSAIFQGVIPYSSDNAIQEWTSAFLRMPGVLDVRIEQHLINRNVVDNPGIHRGYLQRAFERSRTAIEEAMEQAIEQILEQADPDARDWMAQRVIDELERIGREVVRPIIDDGNVSGEGNEGDETRE